MTIKGRVMLKQKFLNLAAREKYYVHNGDIYDLD